jgi:hypothetical protein
MLEATRATLQSLDLDASSKQSDSDLPTEKPIRMSSLH